MHTNINLEFADFDEYELKNIVTIDSVVDLENEDYAEFKTGVMFELTYDSNYDVDSLYLIHEGRCFNVTSAIDSIKILEDKLVRYLISL